MWLSLDAIWSGWGDYLWPGIRHFVRVCWPELEIIYNFYYQFLPYHVLSSCMIKLRNSISNDSGSSEHHFPHIEIDNPHIFYLYGPSAILYRMESFSYTHQAHTKFKDFNYISTLGPLIWTWWNRQYKYLYLAFNLHIQWWDLTFLLA